MRQKEIRDRCPEYFWVVERGLVGWEPFTQLQPWFFIRDDKMFDATEVWPSGREESPLIAFARRQDCDDIACFDFTAGNNLKVVLIEGWSGGGNAYNVIGEYPTFWEWLKSAIDDVADWSALSGEG